MPDYRVSKPTLTTAARSWRAVAALAALTALATLTALALPAARALAVAPAPAPGPAEATAVATAPAAVRAVPPARLAALSSHPIVGVAATSDARGFWLVAADGGVFTFGDAHFYGSTGAVHLAKPIVGVASTPTGRGYWLVASDGGIFTFGDAHYYGSTGALHLAQPIVGMARTPDGRGYWLVASDGGIFTFGDAGFHGSTGAVHLAKPIVGMASTPTGRGYWLVASDGGVFAFGDGGYHGSTGRVTLAKPIVGMARTTDGRGYWLVATDGGIFTFGDAPFHGSAVAFDKSTGAATVGILAVDSGYWVPNSGGRVDALGAPIPAVPSSSLVNIQLTPPLPANQYPSSSVTPSATFESSCWEANPSVPACNSAALADINRARAGEGFGPLSLPAGFYQMGASGQIVAVANAERTSRGLPALPENAALDQMAAQGAQGGYDPSGPAGYGWGSNIAWGWPTALAADFGWMYDDGPASPNIECVTAGAPGCWGHRKNILAAWGGAAGAGAYDNAGVMQLTELFVENY